MQAPMTVRSLLCSWFGRSDARRWSNAAELSPDWDERTRLIARLIDRDSQVIEFGAGRRQLERYLPAGCTYVPSDFIERGEGTLVCDLNVDPRPDLGELPVDTAVFGGVLEYIKDLRSLVTWIGMQSSIRRCIVSYECAYTLRSDWRRFGEVLSRARVGWVNTFHEEEFLRMFQQGGFTVVRRELWHTPSGSEPIFVFGRGHRSYNSAV
jgi:hypothetical protein